ncbi:beta-defensin 125 [Papio anubis]|uniref:Beta-defensin n=3 Tax=Cercopithecinae TaxID=9528 RepID=A0A2K5L153_CERAT|nr:beta-defensin 125 [Papio anubis]XP_011907801.1 PREDICTED: beta-defensin 125 [Cercocebus atys]XP_025256117.1 beta-defensin 125 [Theropithecus gelada]
MNLLILTFIICGLLTQVTKGSFEPQKCWKNNIGYCRRRCLDTERYILLCRNKLSCCISIIISYEYTRRPPFRVIHLEDITFDYSDMGSFTGSPVSKLSDLVTFDARGETMTPKTNTPETTMPPSETTTSKTTMPSSKTTTSKTTMPPPSQMALTHN